MRTPSRGFGGLRYCSVQSVQKGGWSRWQQCESSYGELCVGVAGTKKFKCGNAGDSEA